MPSLNRGESPDSNVVDLVERNNLLAKELRDNAITSEDWELILKARRLHGHSPQAMQRISNLLVGEVMASAEVKRRAGVEMDDMDTRVFDPYEYRRYALTKKVGFIK